MWSSKSKSEKCNSIVSIASGLNDCALKSTILSSMEKGDLSQYCDLFRTQLAMLASSWYKDRDVKRIMEVLD